MSKREERLKSQADRLRARELVAQIRVNNAQKGLNAISHALYGKETVGAHMEELNAARAALAGIHQEQQDVVSALRAHTASYPDGAMIMVVRPEGWAIYGRCDPFGVLSEDAGWHPLCAEDCGPSLKFREAVGDVECVNGDDAYVEYEYFRLYTQIDLGITSSSYPDLSMIMVESSEGVRVYERRDPEGVGDEESGWYPLNSGDDEPPLTLGDITGGVLVVDGEDIHFQRLYTQYEVDDLKDQAEGY